MRRGRIKDLGAFDALLADNLTFSSAAGDDYISKSTFKAQSWDTQINLITVLDLERIATGSDEPSIPGTCRA